MSGFDIKAFGDDMAESGRILGRCQQAREDADIVSASAVADANAFIATLRATVDELTDGDVLSDEIRRLIAKLNEIERGHLHEKNIGDGISPGEAALYAAGVMSLRRALECFQMATRFQNERI